MTAENLYSDDLLNYGHINYSLFGLENLTFSELVKKMEGRKIFIQFWMWPFFFWMTFSIGIIGNGMVGYIVIRKKQMWTRTNFYLLNLAVADILYLITTIPSTTYWTNYWPCGQFWCKFSVLDSVICFHGIRSLIIDLSVS